ncbi:hypothetical protein [Aeromicrobium camelliae]|uniref:hypothetical protein n=1 Tax=Aeromicrobium camelliae TaxID=1538144 RepID=UPI001AA01FAD|nr:hypothetical protein [Aeromicrobium camelliae]
MSGARTSRHEWAPTTHAWASEVDAAHLRQIRSAPQQYAPDPLHLVLELLAYPVDEAPYIERQHIVVTLGADGSVSIADTGRGTDTRFDDEGLAVRKPIIATKDLRFFDHPDAETLADGHPRRGVSVVAALSEWLVHENRRAAGAWTQRYEQGVPVTGLEPINSDAPTGTTITFRPDPRLVPGRLDIGEVRRRCEQQAGAVAVTVTTRKETEPS